MEPRRSSAAPMPLGALGRTLLGIYMVVLSGLLVYLMFALWPTSEPDASGKVPASAITLFAGLIQFTVSVEVQLILLVAVAVALGSYVHVSELVP